MDPLITAIPIHFAYVNHSLGARILSRRDEQRWPKRRPATAKTPEAISERIPSSRSAVETDEQAFVRAVHRSRERVWRPRSTPRLFAIHQSATTLLALLLQKGQQHQSLHVVQAIERLSRIHVHVHPGREAADERECLLRPQANPRSTTATAAHATSTAATSATTSIPTATSAGRGPASSCTAPSTAAAPSRTSLLRLPLFRACPQDLFLRESRPHPLWSSISYRDHRDNSYAK